MSRRKSKSKGDPEKILKFLKTHEPISEEDAREMTTELRKGRKRTPSRNISFE